MVLALIFFCAVRSRRGESFIQNIHFLFAAEVKVLEYLLKVIILVLELGREVVACLFNFFLVNVEGQQINFNGSLECFTRNIGWLNFAHPRMTQNLPDPP